MNLGLVTQRGNYMSYSTLEERIRQVPEEYLDEVEDFVEYIIAKSARVNSIREESDMSSLFGCLKRKIDGMEYQRSVRNEWE